MEGCCKGDDRIKIMSERRDRRHSYAKTLAAGGLQFQRLHTAMAGHLSYLVADHVLRGRPVSCSVIPGYAFLAELFYVILVCVFLVLLWYALLGYVFLALLRYALLGYVFLALLWYALLGYVFLALLWYALLGYVLLALLWHPLVGYVFLALLWYALLGYVFPHCYDTLS